MRFESTPVPGGFILADAELAPEADWFDPDFWRARGEGIPLGRGRGVAVSAGPGGRWVLRHYRRGGLPGRWIADRYLWTAAERTRPVRELRVLAELAAAGAPVPRPVAARVLRAGMSYRGDLITERVEGARTLADAARQLPMYRWQEIGQALRRFHEAGGRHADLNARNIILSPSGVFVIDLDRGRRHHGCAARRRNLARLERSLRKLQLLPAVEAGWQALLSSYAGR